jgi:hypothetical protein
MYVILTTKPKQFRTEVGSGIHPVEAYEYTMAGKLRARFVIAQLAGAHAVAVIDEAPPPIVNHVPLKLFAKYETIESARSELKHLVSFGSVEASLELTT